MNNTSQQINSKQQFVELLISKKAKEISSNLAYQCFQLPNLSSIFIRTYSTGYSVALISDSEHFIIKVEEYKDCNITSSSNLLYSLLKDNDTIIVEKEKKPIKKQKK